MEYQSTRSTQTASPREAVLRGIAPDGGLYLLPHMEALSFDWQACLKQNFLGAANEILSALLPDIGGMEDLVRRAYTGRFETPEIAPLVPVGEDYVLELFHGPTAAFKDVALSMLPQLLSAARAQTGDSAETAILTATSGDTGKAALEGFRDIPGTQILVFYPSEGVSPIQQAQMVTQEGRNVTVCAVRGNFDDCQRGVKEAFAALPREALRRAGVELSSANSINIGRLAPQIPYYFTAYRALLDRGAVGLGDPVDFVVPTGNFGDILAGYLAKALGLPVGRLICASNSNRVLTDFLTTGRYDSRRPFLKTSSPSMDILVSSNLERLLFLASGGDSAAVAGWMDRLGKQGAYEVPKGVLARIQEDFSAYFCDEAQTTATIGEVWRAHRYLIDPHTAVAFSAARQDRQARKSRGPRVILSTASAFKFPEPVLRGLGAEAEGDAFDQMDALASLTGQPVPGSLAGLREKPRLHRDCIGREEIVPYIRKRLGLEDAV